jgi:hypothetical protein
MQEKTSSLSPSFRNWKNGERKTPPLQNLQGWATRELDKPLG